MALTRAEAKKVMLSFKGIREGSFFRRPAIFYNDSYVARVHDKEEAVALRIGSIEMRDVMLEAEPRLFYIIDHYRNFPMLLARLSQLTTPVLKKLMLETMAEVDAKQAKKRAKEEAKAQRAAERAAKKAAKAPLKKVPKPALKKTAKKSAA